MKISSKLMLFIVILSVLVVTASGVLVYNESRKAIEQRLEAQLESIAVLKDNQIEQFFYSAEEDLLKIANDPLLISSMEQANAPEHLMAGDSGKMVHNQSPHDEIRVQLLRRVTYDSDFLELFILSTAGNIHVSTKPENEGKIRDREPYFINGRSATYIQNFYYAAGASTPTITTSIPVKSNDGALLGVLAANLNINRISDIMAERAGLGETGETFLVNQFNYMVTKSRFLQGSEFKKAIYTEDVKACMKGGNGSITALDYRGVKTTGYYTWLPDRQACLIAEIDHNEAFAPIENFKGYLVSLLLIVVIVIFVAVLFFSRTITNPIMKLLKGTTEFAKGNFDYRVHIKSNDELEVLGTSFNKTGNELRKLRELEAKHGKDLEDEVAAKTSQLKAKLEQLEKFHKFAVDRELKMIELKNRIKELERKP